MALVPITNKILKIFEPTILPIAISAFPRLAAVTEVTNSGRDVPNATMVNPIIRSLTPKYFAIPLAPSTAKLEPRTTITIPMTVKNNRIGIVRKWAI